MQDDATDELYVEVAHLQASTTGLSHDGEGVEEDVVEARPLGELGPELAGAVAQLLVREVPGRSLAIVDGRNERLESLELSLVLGSDDLGEEGIEH